MLNAVLYGCRQQVRFASKKSIIKAQKEKPAAQSVLLQQGHDHGVTTTADILPSSAYSVLSCAECVISTC